MLGMSMPTPPPNSPAPASTSIPTAQPVSLKPSKARRAASAVRAHYKGLAGWKRMLVVLAFVASVVGVVGTVGGVVRAEPAEKKAAVTTIEGIRGTAKSSNLTPEQKATLEQAQAKVSELSHWFYDQTAPQLSKMGLGFIVAFVLGIAFRQFVKTMATVTALVLAMAGVAGYFGWVDFSSVKNYVTDGTGWAMEQMGGVKDTVLKLAGASLSGTVGFFIGFMRR
jgi:uncharacterized membrane protein (Fun14 family)